jgi:hypothetical protein
MAVHSNIHMASAATSLFTLILSVVVGITNDVTVLIELPNSKRIIESTVPYPPDTHTVLFSLATGLGYSLVAMFSLIVATRGLKLYFLPCLIACAGTRYFFFFFFFFFP